MAVTSMELGAPVKVDFLTFITPKWGRKAGNWIEQQTDPAWRVTGMITALCMFIIGGSMLFGGGYTSIQGIRVPLADLGLAVETDGIPALPWWILPLACTFIQILVKFIPGTRPIWYPSVIFDATTTALFVSIGIMLLLVRYGHQPNLYIVAAVASLIGLLNAVGAESVFLSGCYMIRSALTRR